MKESIEDAIINIEEKYKKTFTLILSFDILI
jgi:hypothetical protein